MSDGTDSEEWLRSWHTRPSARLRLLCLPPAGSPAEFYRSWATLLPPYAELVAVELPGHGTRWSKPLATSFEEISDTVAAALDGLPDRPTAVYGHSMGSVLALETARAMARRGHRPPAALLVSSWDAPSVTAKEHTDLTDEELVAVLRRLGGIDERSLSDRVTRDAALTVLRADLAMLAAYQYTDGPPLDCPVVVYTGTGDNVTTPAGLAAWRRENPRDFRLHRMSGDHFFFRGSERPYLARMLADAAGRPAGIPGAVHR